MPAYFLDSSAIVKRYLIERGSSWVKDLTDPARRNRCYLVGIAGAEVVAALARRASLGGPSQTMLLNAIADFRRDFSLDFRVIDVTTTLISSAMDQAGRHVLRGYDSVQLAAAIQVHSEFVAHGAICTLVSADAELNAAALAEGLTVENPNAHP